MKIYWSWWIVLCLLGLSTHELIDVWIRPTYGGQDDLLGFLLGVAPNFLAAALIFPFGVLMFREHQYRERDEAQNADYTRWFWYGLIGSQLGLLIWELMQMHGGNLIYDPADIAATVLGGLVAVLLFYQIKSKKKDA